MSEPQTVRVRIAVAVQPDGEWNAVGWSEVDEATDAIVFAPDANESALDPMRNAVVHWVEADVPLPLAPQTVQGSVTSASEGT